jgi:hypothetical protein
MGIVPPAGPAPARTFAPAVASLISAADIAVMGAIALSDVLDLVPGLRASSARSSNWEPC